MSTKFKMLILLALWLLLSAGGPSIPGGAIIVMLHAAEHGPLPPYALGAANELTAAGREVRPIDHDVITGTGEVPAWLKPALAPGRAIMGSDGLDDAMILLTGERVVKAIKLPPSKAEIISAVK